MGWEHTGRRKGEYGEGGWGFEEVQELSFTVLVTPSLHKRVVLVRMDRIQIDNVNPVTKSL